MQGILCFRDDPEDTNCEIEVLLLWDLKSGEYRFCEGGKWEKNSPPRRCPWH